MRHSPADAARASRPLLFLVFGQMRPDYIDRFDLTNFKRLRSSSRDYPDAYVGHLSSQTVVSHLVMPTGLAPKDLPWQDDVFVDEDGVLGTPGGTYRTGDLKRPDMWRLLARFPREQFLAARIQDALGGPVFAVGEKNYAAALFGGPHAAAVVTLDTADGRCTPAGINVPEYIGTNPRFSVDCPDLVGLLADGFGFGRLGDHGGAQELVQRIPMIIRVPGETPTMRMAPLRLMDLAPEITNILGLKPAPLTAAAAPR